MDSGEAPLDDERAHEIEQSAVALEVEDGRHAAAMVVQLPRPRGASELRPRLSEQQERGPVDERRRRRAAIEPVDQTEHADDGRRVDVAAAALVVEAHVTAHHGQVERPTRLRHAVDRLRELPHHLRVLGVAEVEAVDERDRERARARDVQRGLGHD